jgi:hypothetical protein
MIISKAMNKNLFLCLILYLLLAYNLGGQQTQPTITFTNKEHDFGTIRELDGAVSYEFNFTNQGKTPLILNDVKASCGCTTPSWPHEPILPGKTGSIKVSFNPKNRPGPFSKSITITSNADTPSMTLLIKGVVIPIEKTEETYKFKIGDIQLSTIYAAFGEIYKGDVPNYNIKIYNSSPQESAKLTFQKIPEHLKISIIPEVIDPLQEGRIEIKYLTPVQKDWDYVVDRLNLLINGQTLANNRINITANIKEDFSKYSSEDLKNSPHVVFDTTFYNFGSINQNDKIEHSFKLSNTGNSDLFIRKVSASCGCTAVQPEKTVIPPGSSTAIKVIFNAAGREGMQKKAITIITNDPKRSRTLLWITGNVIKENK